MRTDELLNEILNEIKNKNEFEKKELLTVEETARVLSVSYNTCNKIMKRKSFPKVWNGSRMMTIKSELNGWLKQNTELIP